MNGYLLDTNVALLAVHQSVRLSVAVRAAVEEGPAYLSVIAYWEVMIKSMKGALDVGNLPNWWGETIDALELLPLHFRPEHVAALYPLPTIHRDHFDRALIAQATVEDLTLLTTDALMARYASERFRLMQ